jgi:hypothetical protein
VNVIAWRNGLDRTEAGVFEAPGKNDVTVKPIGARGNLGEGHADLKSNPRLFQEDAYRAESAHGGDDLIEQRANFGAFASEMMFEIVAATGVGLVAVGEEASAFLTLPKRAL